MAVTLDLARDHELDADSVEKLRELLATCFPNGGFANERTYLKQVPQNRLLAYEGKSLVGHLGIEDRFVGTPIGPRRILGVVDVCVLPARRRQGLAADMLSWVNARAERFEIPFLMLFAQDRRLYERCGYSHATNPLRWTMIADHESTGIDEQPLDELMIKPVGREPWPTGLVDLLGHQF